MDKQQSSLNGYLKNWSLMAITSFIWLQISSVPLASVTGIPVLQEELYVQLMASLTAANIIATMSIIVHIYIKRNFAFLQLPVIIWSVETLLNLECLVILLAAASGFADNFQMKTEGLETVLPDDRPHLAIVLLIVGIGMTNSFIQLSKELFAGRIDRSPRILQLRRENGPVLTEKLPVLTSGTVTPTFSNGHLMNGPVIFRESVIPTALDRSVSERAVRSYGQDDEEDWKFSYRDELIFYFGYCICFPGYFQDYVGPPLQGSIAIELPPQTSTQVANNRPIRLRRGRFRLRYRRLLTHLMVGRPALE